MRDLLARWEALPEERCTQANQALDEPLTERELEILQLIAAGLNSPEIAQRLHLAVSTVRWYLRRAYSKLEVHNRCAAIARARERQLLS